MRSKTIATSFRIVSHVVLLLMVMAIAYAGGITLMYWAGISV